MKITVTKITDEKLLKEIIGFMSGMDNPKISLKDIYQCEHSPIYSQIFFIKMENITSFVSVHFTRHEKNGCQHFVSSNRGDITGKDDAKIDRYTPVNHAILCNAKHLIDIARKRACLKSHIETIKIMSKILIEVSIIDAELSKRMLPDCLYRGGKCYELKSCGFSPKET